MNRTLLAVSLLALGAGLAAPAVGYPGDGAYGQPYPPSYQQGYPQGYPPPGYPQAYPPPRGARPPGTPFMPQASAPTDAASLEAARRLYTVADTLVLKGASLCGSRVRPSVGFRAWSRDRMSSRAAARQGLDHSVTVFSIARGGPAREAGLHIGDKITSVNGESIPAIAGAMRIYEVKIHAALSRRGPVSIGYTRNGERGVATVKPAPACDYRVVYSNNPTVNALTDGHSVTVMRGMLTLLGTDEELALVIGHEIGHNVLGHFARGRALGHEAGPFNPGAQASMRQFEKEADYIGLFFVALSGYDVQAAITNARRTAARSPMGDRGSPTHPSAAERQAVLYAALRDIRSKQAQRQPLRPNMSALAATAGAPYRGDQPGMDYRVQ